MIVSKLISLAGQQDSKSNKILSDAHISNSPVFNMNNTSSNESFKPVKVTNAAQVSSDLNQITNDSNLKTVHPNFSKEPFTTLHFSDNKISFNIDNVHQRPPPPPQTPLFPSQLIPPELVHQFFPLNSFVPPSFIPPNGAFPPPLMINPSHMNPPPYASHFFAQYNAMMQSSQKSQENIKNKSDESNLTDKLLKNSKFTPTSVFRKLNDQNKTKLTIKNEINIQTKSEIDILNVPLKVKDTLEINQIHQPVNEPSNMRLNNSSIIPHPLSNYNQPTNGIINIFVFIIKNIRLINLKFLLFGLDKNASDIASFLQQLNVNCTPNSFNESKPNAVTLNPNDIFSAMKKNELIATNTGLPPLPTKNAFKLEDLEKF